jgi:hypothetical protein
MKTKNKITINPIYDSGGSTNEEMKKFYDSLSRKVTDEDFNGLYLDYVAKEKQEKRIKVIDGLFNTIDHKK